MFSFFKKKEVRISPKTKILNQIENNIKSIDNIRAIKTVDDIVESSVSLLIEDNKMLGELYASIIPSPIIFDIKDIKPTSKTKKDDILDILRIPLNSINYDVQIKCDDIESAIKDVNANAEVNLIKNISNNTFNSDSDYNSMNRILSKRNKLSSSRLKPKIKKLVLDKQVKLKYNDLIEKMYKDILPTTYVDLIDNFESINTPLLFNLMKIEKIYNSKVSSPYVSEYYKTLIYADDTLKNMDDIATYFKEDLLNSHQITLVSRAS